MSTQDIYPQEPPFSIQIEFSEGCNLYCSFCGLQGIRERGNKNFKFMTIEQALGIGAQIHAAGWTSRIELAMHGEPTMNPEYIELVAALRWTLPNNQLMMTSNGGGLLPDVTANVINLFRAGLNILALDDYEGIKIISKVRAKEDDIRANYPRVEFYEYPRDKEGNPHHRGSTHRKMITYLQDPTSASSGTHSTITNHAGAAFPKDYSKARKRCHRPFREMAIRWDGSVAVCCNDWRGEYGAGNVHKDGLMGVWHSVEMNAARQKLYHGQRDFGPCHGCNAVSYRAGFLPDKSGNDELPLPDAYTEEVIAATLSRPPLTAPILRPWEK